VLAAKHAFIRADREGMGGGVSAGQDENVGTSLKRILFLRAAVRADVSQHLNCLMRVGFAFRVIGRRAAPAR
jgi:hypothetical protein